jgi:hypothetical protein
MGTPRKPFEPPALTVYGDIASLTQTVGMAGMPDSSKGKSRGTQV